MELIREEIEVSSGSAITQWKSFEHLLPTKDYALAMELMESWGKGRERFFKGFRVIRVYECQECKKRKGEISE